MKRLTIIYNDSTIFDGEVDEFGWQDSAQQVSVVGKLPKRQAAQSGGGGLLDILTNARKDRTAAVIEGHKRELDTEVQTA